MDYELKNKAALKIQACGETHTIYSYEVCYTSAYLQWHYPITG